MFSSEFHFANIFKSVLVQLDDYRTQNSGQAAPSEACTPQPLPTKSHTLASRYGVPEMQISRSTSGTQTAEQELSLYLAAEVGANTDPVAFWHVWRCAPHPHLSNELTMFEPEPSSQASRSIYPMLFCIAMDYLPIQASLVPCEHVFSSSAETMTKRHNHISPVLLEALQMLKFFLKKEHLDFTTGWVTSQKEMQVEMEECDLLASIVDANLAGDTLLQAVDDIIGIIADDEGEGVSDDVVLF
jgi:hypothetical protein